MKGHSDQVNSAAFSPDELKIVSVSADNTVRVWNAVAGDCDQMMEGHTDQVLSALFSPDGKQIVSGSLDTIVRVWETPH